MLNFRNFHRNISWTVDMNMQMSELMMSSPHLFPYILYIYNFFFFFFAQTCQILSPYQNILEKNNNLSQVDIRQVLLSHSWNMRFSLFLGTNIMKNFEAMTSSAIYLPYRLFLKCFNIYNFIQFTSNFLLFCMKLFALSFKIK